DLVVFTADHGHTDRGGHGGATPEVRRVLTCFAGRGVARGPDGGVLPARALAPALAVLVGLPYPRHMAPDGPDGASGPPATAACPTGYLDARRAGLARFAAATPDWPRLYEDAERAPGLRFAASVAVLAALLAWRRRAAPWMLATVAAAVAAHRLVFGGLDISA